MMHATESTYPKVILHIDGAARGNPGEAGLGVVLSQENGNVIETYKRYLGTKTNNEAEYEALIAGLSEAVGLSGQIHVFSDSELLVRQMRGEYKVKNTRLKVLYAKACKLVEEFEAFDIEHVRRENNQDADRLANEAIDERAV